MAPHASPFRVALERHLRAIRERNLEALALTLPRDDLLLVMADGKVERRTSAFLAAHRDWFRSTDWTLEVTPIQVWEEGDTGIAVLRLDYRETPSDRPWVKQPSILTLVFQPRQGEWVMVLDQNTPVR